MKITLTTDTTEKRVKLLILLGEMTHPTYTKADFEADIKSIPDMHNEFIRAFHEGDIIVDTPIRLHAAGKYRLLNWVKQ